jgi:hypothetical protein
MYKLNNSYMGNVVVGQVVVKSNSDGTTTCFLQDPANTDYQEYLKWVAEGNEPLPADGE